MNLKIATFITFAIIAASIIAFKKANASRNITKFTTQPVYSVGGSFLLRWENSEVICYQGRTHGGVSCKFK